MHQQVIILPLLIILAQQYLLSLLYILAQQYLLPLLYILAQPYIVPLPYILAQPYILLLLLLLLLVVLLPTASLSSLELEESAIVSLSKRRVKRWIPSVIPRTVMPVTTSWSTVP